MRTQHEHDHAPAAASPEPPGAPEAPAAPTGAVATSWNAEECVALIGELQTLRAAMLERAATLTAWVEGVHPEHRASALNLAHYLALRRFDIRRLQERLALIGVSSLGRAETHVLANLDKVLGLLHLLAGRPWQVAAGEPVGYHSGSARLQRNAERLFGAAPPARATRVMVTLPSEAAHDAALVAGLVAAGMDVARINCAHDDATAWTAMARRVREAGREAGRPVRVLMDLGGPKLRTGLQEAGPAILRMRPRRDERGRVVAPARLALRPAGSGAAADAADATVGVPESWLARLQPGMQIRCTDTRDAEREFEVVERHGVVVIAEARHTAYLGPETRLQRRGAKNDAVAITEWPAARPGLRLQRGDRVRLVAEEPSGARGAAPAPRPARAGRARPATLGCTLPEALAALRKGERVWFDDGRIGAVVRGRRAGAVELEVTHARDGGEWLGADKGINLPDTRLALPALTAQDLQDLDVVARSADIVGLSFAQSAADVRALQSELARRGAAHVGVLLKVETRRGFEHLPEMLFAAMAGPSAGVMIARGDLAVECGYERLAEVQEEILWACEAAHLPVVWATQVLETLAKTGRPSRAEITDAAMGVRAECVMLNKGPHITDAIRMLDDILRRMQAHQTKKRPLLRALASWRLGPAV